MNQLVLNEDSAKQEIQHIPHPDAMLSFIERAAADPTFDAAKLRELLEMRREFRKDAAREAFAAAMFEFKKKPPQVTKNKHVSFTTSKGTTEYDHATLDHACDQVVARLNDVGIFHRWRPDPASRPSYVKVTCILTHELGHSEETPLEAPDDPSGGKNPIQAVASTTSYLQRYTLLMAVGIAAKGVDNDGRGSQGTSMQIPADIVVANVDAIANSDTMEVLMRTYKACYRDANDANDKTAMKDYISAKDKRKKELSAQ